MKKVVINICITAFLFGTMEVALKVAGSGMDSLQLTFLRFTIGGIMLLPLGLKEMKQNDVKLKGKDVLWLLLVGIMGIPISMLCFQLGVVRCNAATASSLICLNPIFTMMIAHFFTSEKMNRAKYIAFAIGLVATVFMIRPWDIQAGNSVTGMILMLIASVTFAAYTVMGKKSIARIGTFFQTSISFFLGSGVLLGIMLFMHRPIIKDVAQNWLLVLYIGVFVTGIGYMCYFIAIKYSDATTGSIAFFIKPAIAPVFAVMLLHESILWSTIVGIILLISASFITLRSNFASTKLDDEDYEGEIESVFAEREPGVIGKHKYCSVFIPLVRKDGKDHIMFEVRASGLENQPGEICFPGGEKQKSETPEGCAIRETMEEIGLKREDLHVISQTDTFHGITGLMIYCFIGRISEDNIDINHDEVAETFLVPLDFFRENKPEVYDFEVIQKPSSDFPYDKINFENGYEWRKGTRKVPIYIYDGRPIWGLTARILLNIVSVLEEESKE